MPQDPVSVFEVSHIDDPTVAIVNNFFAKVAANLANKIPFIRNDNPAPPEILHVPTLLDEITPDDVKLVSKRICVYKSSGLRLVTSRIWKILYTEFADVFTKMYTIITRTGKYPKE